MYANAAGGSLFVRERDIPRMDIQEGVSSGEPEHLRHVECIGPPPAEQLAHALQVLINHMLLKVGNLLRSFGPGEIQDERPLHNRHLDDP